MCARLYYTSFLRRTFFFVDNKLMNNDLEASARDYDATAICKQQQGQVRPGWTAAGPSDGTIPMCDEK